METILRRSSIHHPNRIVIHRGVILLRVGILHQDHIHRRVEIILQDLIHHQAVIAEVEDRTIPAQEAGGK